MRNGEGYKDPTAGGALSHKIQENFTTVPQKKKRKTDLTEKKEIKYYYKPVYTAK
jgi:hypothetical protein